MPSDDEHPSLQLASQLPGAIFDDASEISGALSRSESPVFTDSETVTHGLHVLPVQVDRHMSPGELDWYPNTAPPSPAFAAVTVATYSSPQGLVLSASDSDPRRLSSFELDWSANTAPPPPTFAATYSSPQKRLLLSDSDAGPRRLSSTVTRTWSWRSDTWRSRSQSNPTSSQPRTLSW